MEHYDLIVVGGGPGGYTAAIRAAQEGMKTALVEARQLGGTCLNRGCIPTKALLHASGLLREIAAAAEFGILTAPPQADMAAVHARKDKVVTQLREGVGALLEKNGVTVVSGHATLLGEGRVAVEGESPCTLRAEKILIAVGAAPARPPIPGLEYCLDSDALLAGPPQRFESLIVIGGGVIGMEMASVYQGFGCRVTVLEAAERVLPLLDREIAQNLTMILKKRGVAIQAGCKVLEITKMDAGVRVRLEGKGGEEVLEAEAVLLATGRAANLSALLGEGVALACARGIVVNERFETSLPGVYAIGDCVQGSIQLAHAAAAEAANVIALMAGKQPPMRLDVMPACVYTSPEIASVGMTAEEAKAAGLAAKTAKFLMNANGKSLIEAEERGFVKLLVEEETERLLGAQLMCGRATELISALAAALAAGETVREVAALIRPHPSFAEGISEAAEDFFGHAIHILPKKKRA